MPRAPSSSTTYVNVTRKKQAVAVQAQHFTHFDGKGQAHMVDVGAKPATHRVAVASGRISMQPATLRLIAAGRAKKGDVLGVAELAGVMGAKRTSELIPLCHPLPLTDLQVTITPDRANGSLRIRAEAACTSAR